MPLLPFLHRVAERVNLTSDEAHSAMNVLLEGGASDTEVAGFLVALRMKGETAEELAGFARAMREHMIAVDAGDVVDNCGTGGDRAGTVNISTAAAFVAAEWGIPIAKTGNRSVSSRCGSADVLEQLGVRLDPPPEVARRCLDELGICFVFAPQYHAGVRHAAPVRKALGVRTVFNLVGPIANAARPTWQMMGIYDPALCEPAARTLALLGRRVALAVHGDGLDEVALHGITRGILLRDGQLEPVTISPADAGLEATLDAWSLSDPRKEWVPDQWEGYLVEITSGAHKGSQRWIATNSESELILASDWLPLENDFPSYRIFAPTVPALRWSPYGVPVVLLGDQAAACRDTRAAVCPIAGHPCVSGITADDVVRAVGRLTSRSAAA